MVKLLSGPTGPYKSHGYLMCRVKYPDGKIKMVTYHKYVYEKAYGPLPKGYVVHHKDENKNNNKLENLEAITKGKHGKLHSKPGEILTLICVCCGKEFQRLESQEYYNRKRLKDGPFCSRRCTGKVHH